MKPYTIQITPEAENDLEKLDNSSRAQVDKIIERVSLNPLPKNEGGYGKVLGNKGGYDLTGCCSIKLLKLGIRVVYKVIREGSIMRIIIVAAREDDEVYRLAARRLQARGI